MKMVVGILFGYLLVVLVPVIFVCSMTAFYYMDASLYNPLNWEAFSRSVFNFWWAVVTAMYVYVLVSVSEIM